MRVAPVIAAVVFALVAIGQAVRYFSGWEVVVNGTAVPLWVSAVTAGVAAILSVLLFQDAGRKA
jgi:hypothetical protein